MQADYANTTHSEQVDATASRPSQTQVSNRSAVTQMVAWADALSGQTVHSVLASPVVLPIFGYQAHWHSKGNGGGENAGVDRCDTVRLEPRSFFPCWPVQ